MSTNSLEAKGFFAALFDTSFRSFITLKFLKVIYIVLMVIAGLAGLALFVSLASRGGGGIVIGLILAPIVTLLYLVLARVYCEIVAVLFRIGENTSIIAAQGGSGGPVTGYGYGSGPSDPSGQGYGPPPTV